MSRFPIESYWTAEVYSNVIISQKDTVTNQKYTERIHLKVTRVYSFETSTENLSNTE